MSTPLQLSEETPTVAANQAKRNRLVVGIVSLAVVIGSLVILNLPNTQTQGVGTYRNYSADAIIQGGAITEKEMLQKYDQNASGVQSVFKHYGISRSDLTGETSQIKHGIVYQDGRVVVDGKTVATNAYSVSRKAFYDTRGNAPRKVNINGTTFYEGPNMSIFLRSVDAFVYFRNGQFYRAVLSSCANPVVATPPAVEKPPVEKPPVPVKQPDPVYSCDSLKAIRSTRTKFNFETVATAKNGAQIVSYTYDFGDGKTETVTNSTVSHEYVPGTYTVKVTVNVKVGDKTVAVPGPNCQTQIVVEKAPEVPVYKCETLTARLIQGQDRTYAYDLLYTAEGGATLTKVTYDFGDGTSETVTARNATAVEHHYAAPGTYTTTTTLYFSVKENGKAVEKSSSCQTAVTIAKPENCPLPGKEHLPKNSPECTEPLVETPPELPRTGLSEWLAGGIGLAALAAAGYYWNTSRQNLINTMLKK